MLGDGVDDYDKTTHHKKARKFFNSLSSSHSYARMDDFRGPAPRRQKGTPLLLLSSYVFDWVIILVVGAIGLWLGKMKPNMRPFQLESPHISFPFTEKETVPMVTAGIANTLAPVVIIAIISLVMVPGSTVPPGTPKQLIWRRKLWELHQGLLGLALSCCGAWFVTNGMKNMFGRPRPDMLSRCMPDLENVALYVVGGIANTTSNGQLVSAKICTNTDSAKLEDGFRSFPSGHSSSSSAGLLYLSLFIASKFAITIPFLAPASYSNVAAFSAFPSRLRRSDTPSDEMYELVDRRQAGLQTDGTANGALAGEELSRPADPQAAKRIASHTRAVAAVRLSAAAPPLYLLLIACLPTFGAIFISSSRWFDFRHHAFDIMFGFTIGVVTAVFAFRYYHLPITQGAGWAWGPRSNDKAYWAGIGSYSYATNRDDWSRAGDEEEAVSSHPGLATVNTDYDSVRRAHMGSRSGTGTGSTIGAMKRGENSSMASRASPPPGHHMDADNRV